MSVAPNAEGRVSPAGLRPGLVFLAIGIVLVLVAARSVAVALAADGEQPQNLRRRPVLPPAFELCDSAGVPMASSAEYLELVMSPNAMWQAHTPDAMLRKIAAALGEEERADELFERMLPDGSVSGWITCTRDPLVLDAHQAARVQAWITTGVADPERPCRPVSGFALVAGARAGEYQIAWHPATALSEAERARQGCERPRDWTRRIADALSTCVLGQPVHEALTEEEDLRDQRESIWRALLPSQFRVVRKDVAPGAAPALHALLKEERVQPLQMELRRNARRVYPVQGDLRGTATPLAILGRWSTLLPEAARKTAIRQLALPVDEDAWTEFQRAELGELVERLVYEPSPTSGLELLASRLLQQPEYGWIGRRGEEYTYLLNQAPRRPLQRYFQELVPGDPRPEVVTTLDLRLQRRMRELLQEVVVQHKPALAEAIAIDLETGGVLAVDAIDVYGMGGYAPTMHTFTPGSTFKVPVMGIALHEGRVTPQEPFQSFNGQYRIEGRAIREAEGGDNKGRVTAAEGLAYSINAVLVQIGTRVPAPVLRQHLIDLGYADYPRTGLGGERSGQLTPLPWKTKFTHASISFGHEIHVTLWQHAAALATVLRGGRYRPLRLVDAVQWNGRREELPLVENHPLQSRDSLSADACAKVRDMMRLGATIGTGRLLCKDLLADVDVGTKTGTAQKVPGELCLHLELQHNIEHGCRGAAACRRELARNGRPPHRSCYTSSIVVVGRLRPAGREVMVLVVVDEPRSRVHFGSQVAGPAAMGILREALGLTRGGDAPLALAEDGFHAVEAAAIDEGSDQPWAEAQHAPH